jgi:hypothetical protein
MLAGQMISRTHFDPQQLIDYKIMAKKVKTKKLPEHIETIEAKHDFSDPEKIGLLEELSRAHHEAGELKEQAKHSATEWKNRIKSIENKISTISNKATSGYEFRPTECRVEFDTKKEKKTYFNKKTGEKVETRDMTPADFELPLFKTEPLKKGENIVSVGAAFDGAQTEPSPTDVNDD